MSATVASAVTPRVEELTPAPTVAAVAARLAHMRHLLVLDSADAGGDRGRYSYVMAGPREWHTGTFAALEAAAGRVPRADTLPGLPPFQGGYAGLFGYGLSAEWEPTPGPRFDEFGVPTLAVGRYDTVIAFDHNRGRVWVMSAAGDCRSMARYLTHPLARPARPRPSAGHMPPARLAPQHPLTGSPNVTSNFSRPGYEAAVRRAVDYVHAGDVFQVNLSQRLLTPLTGHPFDVFMRLREVNPAPFGAYFDTGDAQIISASPERFLQVTPAGDISTRPIKGTRPRGSTPAEDAANLRDLLTNPKDRAENVMIVDLLRNDLGRVAQTGSVRVPVVCEPESFPFVHHMVSEVTARLAPGRTAFDLLRAALPGGSVTGAPKIRAMQIIAELEPTARGAYCGSLGYVGFDGAVDTNILIRTFTAAGGYLQFPVGGGVVADSDPAREYAETLHKAAGLLRALSR